WGESHGQALGVVIDGCPAGLTIHIDDINAALSLRSPGKNLYTSFRKEPDMAEILSGIFEGQTTGAPILILIRNQDQDSSKYEPIKNILRPGHANFTYLKKYGIFDHRGGGRASARETAARVAAGAIAAKFLETLDIQTFAYLKQVGNIKAQIESIDLASLQTSIHNSPLFCPDPLASSKMLTLIKETKTQGDSLGGLVEFIAIHVPIGLGDPVYDKLEARLAYAMMGIPASKGFEIGLGFEATTLLGSEHNDLFIKKNNLVQTKTNHAGGILGGISTGMPIIGRVAFKPTSSIAKIQDSLKVSGENTLLQLPPGSRHDPCVAIRAVPVVNAMLALVLADTILLNRCAKLSC
ncbi:MAG: chorismate synthase, partial [Chlamydiota bacterium]